MMDRRDVTTVGRVVESWTQVAGAAVADGRMLPNHCILSSKVLAVALSDRGYDVDVVPCGVAVVNAAARPLIAAGVPFDEWPFEAWSIGVDPKASVDDGYPGHLVLAVSTSSGRFLVDGATMQFARPGRIEIPASLIVPTPSDRWPLDGGSTRAVGPDGLLVEWWPAPHLGQLHRSAPDWTKRWRGWLDRLYTAMHDTP